MNNIIPIKKGSYTPDIEIKGRTLVNVLGRFGNPIYKQCDVGAYGTVKYVGDYATIENPTDSSWITTLSTPHTFIEGEYYICLADIQLIEGEFAYCGIQSQSTEHDESNMYRTYEKNVWVPCVQLSKVGPKLSGHGKQYFAVSASRTTVGGPSKAAFKNARIYKINKELYDLYITKTREELDALYPYVDDVKCVVNPYIESNENLINYHLWNQANTTAEGTLAPSTDTPISGVSIKCEDGTYSLKIENLDTTKFRTIVQANNGSEWLNLVHGTTTEATFVKNNGRYPLIIAFRAIDESAQTMASLLKELKNNTVKVTLVKGNTPKKYEDCYNSRIMFETNLYDEETITRHNDGSYVKNGVWTELQIANNLNVVLASATPGHKSILFPDFKYHTNSGTDPLYMNEARYMVRYDGNFVKHNTKLTGQAYNEFECWHFGGAGSNATNLLYLTIPNSLTGWGDNYTPTQDEIRAFFLGWRMFTGTSLGNATVVNEVYNGTGQKWWTGLWSGVGEKSPNITTANVVWNVSASCPTRINDQGFTPYKLIYKKANPVTEEVKTYGSLLVKEGVDVNTGSGLVLNEMFGVFSSPYHTRVPLNRSRRRAQMFLKATDDSGLDVPFREDNYSGQSEIVFGKPALIPINSDIIKDRLNIDYLIYAADTVSYYDYYLHEPVSVKDALEKMKHETTNCFEELAKTKKELESAKVELSQRTNPNLLINGNFQVWQRGNNFSETATKSFYSADRWHILHQNAKCTVSKLSNGGIRIKRYEPTVTNNVTRITQFFEDGFLLSNEDRTYTLSINYRFIVGDAVIYILSSSGILTTMHIPKYDTSFSINFTLPAGASLKEIFIQQVYDYEIEIYSIKLEHGDIATPAIPRAYTEELALCQRYFQEVAVEFAPAHIPTYRDCMLKSQFMPMRINPSVKFIHGHNGIGHMIHQTGKADIAIGTTSYISTQPQRILFGMLKTSDEKSFIDDTIRCWAKIGLDAEIYS